MTNLINIHLSIAQNICSKSTSSLTPPLSLPDVSGTTPQYYNAQHPIAQLVNLSPICDTQRCRNTTPSSNPGRHVVRRPQAREREEGPPEGRRADREAAEELQRPLRHTGAPQAAADPGTEEEVGEQPAGLLPQDPEALHRVQGRTERPGAQQVGGGVGREGFCRWRCRVL